MKKSKESLCDLWDSIESTKNNQSPEGEERAKGIESLFKEIIAENFSNLRENWTSKFMKPIDHPIISMQKDLLQDTL